MTPTPAPTCPKCNGTSVVESRASDDGWSTYANPCPDCEPRPTAAFRSTQSEPLIPGPSFAELNRERENFATADDALSENERESVHALIEHTRAKPSEPTYNVSAEPYSSKPSEKPEGVRE